MNTDPCPSVFICVHLWFQFSASKTATNFTKRITATLKNLTHKRYVSRFHKLTFDHGLSLAEMLDEQGEIAGRRKLRPARRAAARMSLESRYPDHSLGTFTIRIKEIVMPSLVKGTIRLITVLILATVVLAAQSERGTIRGTITDATGSVMPGV